MGMKDHPTARAYQSNAPPVPEAPAPLDPAWLRDLCLAAGADDVGFVAIDRDALDDQRAIILEAFPRTRTLISFVKRMNRDMIRSTSRSLSNLEFHHTGDDVNDVGRVIAAQLMEAHGIRAVNATMGFPMEMDRWPGRVWVVSHKPVAVAAGLGQIGIHRNVIHPKFGNFILLGTVLIDAEVAQQGAPIDYNPCLSCKLCVAACPTGAISPEGRFDFSACYTHNYREFMGGFSDWVETVADSPNAAAYRAQVTDSETVSWWQSLAFGPNYKAAYCMAVCPAGEDVIGPFLDDRKGFLKEVVKPLQTKPETVYVVPGSDAEDYVRKRFKTKTVKYASGGIRPRSIPGFTRGLDLIFQPNKAGDLNATYHFTFVGDEQGAITVAIRDKALDVQQGHVGSADIHITADSTTWLRFLAKDTSIYTALLLRRIKVDGPLALLKAFGRCFPS